VDASNQAGFRTHQPVAAAKPADLDIEKDLALVACGAGATGAGRSTLGSSH
jgi:hypothetical protein